MGKILRYLMTALSTIFLMAGGVIVFESVVFKPHDGFSFNAVEYCQKNIGNSGDLTDQKKLEKCVGDMWKVERIMPLISTLVGILGGVLIMLGLALLWFGLRKKSAK